MARPRPVLVVWEMPRADSENAKACEFQVQLLTFNELEGVFYAPARELCTDDIHAETWREFLEANAVAAREDYYNYWNKQKVKIGGEVREIVLLWRDQANWERLAALAAHPGLENSQLFVCSCPMACDVASAPSPADAR